MILLVCMWSSAEHSCTKYFQMVFSGMSLCCFLKWRIMRERSPASANSSTMLSSLSSMKEAKYWMMLAWFSFWGEKKLMTVFYFLSLFILIFCALFLGMGWYEKLLLCYILIDYFGTVQIIQGVKSLIITDLSLNCYISCRKYIKRS